MGKSFNEQIISGGNEQEFKVFANALNRMDRGGLSLSWLLKMEVLKKYTNLGHFEGDDELENQRPEIFTRLFWSGQCAVYVGQKGVYTCSYRDVKYGLDSYPESAWVQQMGKINDHHKFPTEKLNRTNAAFIQSNVYKWPLFMGLDKWFEPILRVWPLLDAEIINAITKILLKVPDDDKERDTVIKELEKAFARHGDMWTIISHKIGEITELKTDTINDKLWEHIKSSINFMNQRLGFLYNASEKRERNITSEVAINEMQFTLIRDDLVFYVNKFLRDYNRITGKNVKYVLLQDEIADKEMKRQQMTMLHQGVENEKEGSEDNEK